MPIEIQPSFDTWTSLFLVVALHGIVLASLFFFRSTGRGLPNRLLGIFLFLFSLNLSSNVLFWTRYNLELPHLVGIAGTFQFLYGPLILFYALSIINPTRSFKKWDLIHLIPFLIHAIWMLPFFLQTADQKVEMMMGYFNQPNTSLANWVIIVASVKVLLMTGYGLGILLLPRFARQWTGIPSNRLTEETRKWLQIAGGGFLGYVVSYASYFILVETIDFQIEYDYMISFAMSGFIFGIGYTGLFKPEYLEEAHNGRNKYESSSLRLEVADRYLKHLLRLMEEEKPYLEGDLKLNDLAEKLSIPSHHLSRIINERLNKNFFEFVNSYRVEEAKKMLTDPNKKDFKILRVAFESGFNNKTTFNNTFKNEVGTTPSRFRKYNLNK